MDFSNANQFPSAGSHAVVVDSKRSSVDSASTSTKTTSSLSPHHQLPSPYRLPVLRYENIKSTRECVYKEAVFLSK